MTDIIYFECELCNKKIEGIEGDDPKEHSELCYEYGILYCRECIPIMTQKIINFKMKNIPTRDYLLAD